MKNMRMKAGGLLAVMMIQAVAMQASAQEASSEASSASDDGADFLKLSLKDIADTEVMSVSRHKQKASEAAASLYVITREDIERSGALNLAELLRTVPGLQVARAGSSQWAVSARGFNDQFANKLLVLIDGRTIYSPTFSGVWWDVYDPIHQDIERIEVIRGPGASVWGANAVNGVINIITRSARDTQGSLVNLGAGTDMHLQAEARHGFALSNSAWARVHASEQKFGEEKTSSHTGNKDSWDMRRGGFRVDAQPQDDTQLTLQGDAYQGREDQSYLFPQVAAPYRNAVKDDQEVRGAYLMGRWDKHYSEASQVTVQSYLDYNARDIVVHDNHELTFDLDAQHVYDVNDRYTLTWGAGYRHIEDKLGGSFVLNYAPDKRSRDLYSAFVDNKLALVPDTLFLNLGSKFEHNDFTHFEHQPTARLSWLIDDRQTLWGSISRAVRTPDRSNDDIANILAASPSAAGTTLLVRRGSEQTTSEKLMAYEAGYRVQPTDDLAIDASVFYNDYDNLIINRLGTPVAISSGAFSPYIEVPLELVNGGRGRSYGGELSVNWQATDRWRLLAGYSYLNINLEGGNSSVNTETKSPQQQWSLTSHIDMTPQLQWDQTLSYTDSIGTNTTSTIEDYLRLDMRVSWDMAPGTELSLMGQNLLDAHHPEFGPFLYNSQAEIGRSAMARLTLRF